jgi:tetratricopeptide (TPR) repeat protein
MRLSHFLLPIMIATLAATCAGAAPQSDSAHEKSLEEQVAMLYAETNQPAEAIQHFNVAIKAEPDNGRLYYERGHTFYRMNQYIQATPDYTRSLALGYNPAQNLERRAYCYLNSHQYAKGIDDCTAAIKADPRSRIAYFNRAKAYKLLGESAKRQADEAAIKALDKNPRAKDFNDRCMAVHDPAGRVKLCTAALKLDPSNKDALLYLGNAYLVLEQQKLAEQCFDKLVAMDRDNLVGHIDRGLALADCGQNQKALSDFDLVISRAPHSYKALYWRGRCYTALKRAPQAVADIEQSQNMIKALMATEYAKKSKEYAISLGRFLVETFAACAQAYDVNGDTQKALGQMTYAVNESRQAPVMLAKLLPIRAALYKKAGLIVEQRHDEEWAKKVNAQLEVMKNGPYIPPPPLDTTVPKGKAGDANKNSPD